MIAPLRLLHTGRLVLTPMDPEAVVVGEDLVGALHRVGLIGDALPGRDRVFAPGESFLQLLAFTGCAVQIATPPSASGQTGARVGIPETSSAPRLLTGRNTRPPRCAHCGDPLASWQGLPAGIRSDATALLRCVACGGEAPACAWRWGRHAGCGRSFVVVEEVFPGEGTPLPALLGALQALGVGAWRYFYVQDPPGGPVTGSNGR